MDAPESGAPAAVVTHDHDDFDVLPRNLDDASWLITLFKYIHVRTRTGASSATDNYIYSSKYC